MKDLSTREDIELQVNSFYNKVVKDAVIGFFFKDVVKVDFEQHLPKMYSFWESILFGQMTYKGNPMAVHFPINEKIPMEKRHFEHWVKLWTATIEENFSGEMAETAIYKANNIANLMGFKMETATRLNKFKAQSP